MTLNGGENTFIFEHINCLATTEIENINDTKRIRVIITPHNGLVLDYIKVTTTITTTYPDKNVITEEEIDYSWAYDYDSNNRTVNYGYFLLPWYESIYDDGTIKHTTLKLEIISHTINESDLPKIEIHSNTVDSIEVFKVNSWSKYSRDISDDESEYVMLRYPEATLYIHIPSDQLNEVNNLTHPINTGILIYSDSSDSVHTAKKYIYYIFTETEYIESYNLHNLYDKFNKRNPDKTVKK